MNYELLIQNLLSRSHYFGNTLNEYAFAVAVFSASLLVFLLVQWGVIQRLKSLAQKTDTDLDDMLIKIVENIKPAFYYVFSAYIALATLSVSGVFGDVLNGLLLIVIAYQVVIALHTLIDYALEKSARQEGSNTKNSFRFMGNFIKWALWAVAVLMVLGNLGVNVTSLIAGLGIGGIAVALALQNILSDLFSSFAIYLDKPFEVGDFVTVGENSGTVERIGIKTTRLRALQGEEIVISNKELTSTRIQNFKKMQERRIIFAFGIVYSTPAEKVAKIPQLVESIFSPLGDEARFERAHFKKLADSSLDFEVVYHVPTRDFTPYMDVQQKINLALLEQFEKEGINFAYPTQTIYLEK